MSTEPDHAGPTWFTQYMLEQERIEKLNKASGKLDVDAIATEVMAAHDAAGASAPRGSCFVYVDIPALTASSRLVKALNRAGLGGGQRGRMYIGYDNHWGDVVGRAEAIIAVLNKHGVHAKYYDVWD